MPRKSICDRVISILFLTLLDRLQNFLFKNNFISAPHITEDAGLIQQLSYHVVKQAIRFELDHPKLFHVVFACLLRLDTF
jgi:hypothetical protein